MSRLGTVALIARREFVTRVRTRVFVIGTVLILVGIGGYIALQVLVLNKQAQTTTENVAFLGDVSRLSRPFASAAQRLDFKIVIKPTADEADARRQLAQGKLDAVMNGPATSPHVLVRDQFNPVLQTVLQNLVRQAALNQQLSAAGLNPASVNAQLARATVTVETVKATGAQRMQEVVAGFIVAVLLYIALLSYGQFIAQGVVEEKANRIVEILLSTVRPEQLLVGKVIGIGLVGLFQLCIIGAAGVTLALATRIFTVPTVALGVALSGVLWFVLGFFFYSVLFAAAGSLVSRTEEVQSVVVPMSMLAIASYLAAISVLVPMLGGAPMSSRGKLLALIPPVSPVLMPTGMATGDIAPWQAILAVVLTLATGVAATWVAARIYSNSVLRIGGRVKLGEALMGQQGRRAS